ncbi:phosphotransferase [Spiroplasma endosymbiont of Amphibalanus improvisus]|uniref:phosphotransferase n=1 Tax=Spiroplasma endosymbiont of Amphibalanus improvisus TaxID=3066327 RepID=UPI00313C6C5E
MKFQIKTQLNLGLSNQTFIDINDIFIRYSKSETNVFFNRQNEINVIKNIIPFFTETITIIDYGFDDNNFYVASKFEKKFKHLNDVEIDDKLIEQVIMIIKKFHQIPIKNKVELFDYEKYIYWFYNRTKNWIDRPLEITEIDKCLTKLRNKPMDIVLCHQDLVPGNILIFDNKIKIIDFEFSYLNDKYFDYASLISESFQNDQKYKNIIFEKMKFDTKEIEQVELWIQYQNFLWALWSNYLYQETHKPIYKTIYFEKIKNIK